MVPGNAHLIKEPAIIERARGGPPGTPPNGGLASLTLVTLHHGEELVRFGAKSLDAFVTSGTKAQTRRSAFGEIEKADRKRLKPLARPLHGDGGFAGTIASGEWWLRAREYDKVERFARLNAMPVNVAIRRLCFVPFEWSDLGMVIHARPMLPLLAFEGSGNVARGRASNGRTTWYGLGHKHADGVFQLFVPGLSDPVPRRTSLLVTNPGVFLPTAGD